MTNNATAIMANDEEAIEEFPLLPPVRESGFMPDGSQHASHAGREFRVFDVEFDIYRKLTAMAELAEVTRAHALGTANRISTTLEDRE